MPEREPRRNMRLRLACARCQRRKIRCDMQFPTCSNCSKASAECTDGESLRLRDVPHQRTVSRLRRRITWLESIIQERLPDVDLTRENIPDASEVNEDELGTSQVQGDRQDESTIESRASEAPVAATQPTAPQEQRAHEIGLISMGVNSDQRYIGPSSGYFLARMLLKGSPKRHDTLDRNGCDYSSSAAAVVNELVAATQGPLPLPTRSQASQLCRLYFEVINAQYPLLHEPSFLQSLDQVYLESTQGITTDPCAFFQVFMVFAISSVILTCRNKCRIPGESYCLSALQHFDHLGVETSLPGLQCLILLLIFAIHSPSMKVNAWYLNYHCIAALLDLGLQRNITTSSGISLLNQEMRTRIFWTVFTLDRTIATMMGRPIGVRDEACELRLPQPLSDYDLIGATDSQQIIDRSISLSIHLFKLARINSEIKYVANSIVRDAPEYAYPPVGENIHAWQRNMLDQLDQWAANIPELGPQHVYVSTLCMIRYHCIRMLLLRPSPAIPRPSTESLNICYESSRSAIHLFDELYRRNMLVHDWTALHAILLSTITLFYCVRAVLNIAKSTEPDVLMDDLGMSLSILGAIGEHWPSAKRSRDILADVGRSTILWTKTLKATSNNEEIALQEGRQPSASVAADMSSLEALHVGSSLSTDLAPTFDSSQTVTSDIPPDLQIHDDFWFGPTDEFGDNTNVYDIVQNLFNDFIPQTNNFPTDPQMYNA